MKYEFDKYKWATLLLRARGLFGCGEVAAVSKMAEAGLGLPVAVRMGQLFVLASQPDSVDKLEVFEIEADPDQKFDGRNRKDMMQRHHHLMRFLEAIDQTGDIDGQDIALVVRRGKDGDLRAPPPAIRPPAQQALALAPGGCVDPTPTKLADLQLQLGAIRVEHANTKQLVSQTRMELADLRDRVKHATEQLEKLAGVADNLNQTVTDAFKSMNDRIGEVEKVLAPKPTPQIPQINMAAKPPTGVPEVKQIDRLVRSMEENKGAKR